MATTVIRNASYVVAWDASIKSHTYMQDADVAYEGGTIRFRTLGAGGHPVLDFGTLTLAS